MPQFTRLQNQNFDLGSIASGSTFALSSGTFTSGSLVFAVVRLSTTGATIGLSDSSNGTYSSGYADTDDLQGDEVAVFYKENVANSNPTFTVTFTGGNATTRVTVEEFSGVATSTAFDTFADADFNNTDTPVSGAITPQTAVPALLIGVLEWGTTANGFTQGSTYTKGSQLVSGDLKIGTEYREVTSPSGTYTADFTATGGTGFGSGNVGIVAFKAAAAGGAAQVPFQPAYFMAPAQAY